MSVDEDQLKKLQKWVSRLLPPFLLDRLDPVEKAISEGVASFSRTLPEDAVVLDAGAGEARFRSHFSGRRYIALDSRQGDVSWDYSRLHLVADLLHLPLRDGSCDAVLSVVVLEHISDPFRAARELRRVLRPGGRLWLAAPMIWEIHQAPHDYFRFTRYGLERLLSTGGFAITRLVPIGGYFWLVGRYSFYFLKFWRTGLRAAFLPILSPLFGFLIPLLCYYLDPLDRTGQYTLGYICEARKVE